MKNILEQLYYAEIEENPQVLPDRKGEKYQVLEKARDAFFNALNEEQKKLYFTYESIQREWNNEESLNLYKAAFQSGFLLAEELHKTKNP